MKFSKVTRYKINTWKSFAFLYSNWTIWKKLQNSIIASKKYLEINQEGEKFAQWKLQNTVEDKS